MSTKQSTIDFILEQMVPTDFVTAKKMFGEYALYANGKVVALVCDDQLYVKITAKGKALAGTCEEGNPYPGAKAHLLVSGERWEDRDWLSDLLRVTAESLSSLEKKIAGTKKSKKISWASAKTKRVPRKSKIVVNRRRPAAAAEISEDRKT